MILKGAYDWDFFFKKIDKLGGFITGIFSKKKKCSYIKLRALFTEGAYFQYGMQLETAVLRSHLELL